MSESATEQRAVVLLAPQVGADGRGDAVALGVKVVADLHRVARLALVVVLVHRRLEQERVPALPLAHPVDALQHGRRVHRRVALHELMHLTVDIDLRRLRVHTQTHTVSQ